MLEFILEFELSILSFLQNFRCDFLDTFFSLITLLGDKGILWICLGFILCFVPKYKSAGVCLLFALLINFVICNLTLKPLIARIRPYEYIDGIKLLVSTPEDFSFPSGHSSASFAASYSVWLKDKKWGSLCLCVAGLIAFSRLYLYVHFPSDVLFGIVLGILCSVLGNRLINKLTLF